MALLAVLENLDGLSEEIQKEYIENDGMFYLDVTPVDGFALEDVTGLKTVLAEKKEDLRVAKEALAEFEGVDPEKAKDALSKVEEMSTWTPEQKVKEQIASNKAQLIEAHSAEKRKLEVQIKALIGQLEKNLITATATAAVVDHKGSVELLLPHVERQARLREVDGQYVVEVVDSNGNPRIGNTAGDLMTINQLVEEMKGKEVFAPAFDGSGASGSGAPAGNGVADGGGVVDGDELTSLPPAERLKLHRRNEANKT